MGTDVNIGDCLCPGLPHPDGDIVTLRDKPDLPLGLAAVSALRRAQRRTGDVAAALGDVWVRYGPVSWNIVGEKGVPVELTHDALVARLQWDTGGFLVADAASILYGDVFAPLAPRRLNSSPRMSSDGLTSPSLPSGPKPRSSSQRSLRSVRAASV